MPDRGRQVAVVGVHIKSDAYPNVKYKVEGLLDAAGLRVQEANFPPGGAQRFSRRKRGLLEKIVEVGNFVVAHGRALRAALRVEPACAIYVPYPAVFLLFALSVLPRRWRAGHIEADAFISLYDTVVNDRAMLSAGHPLARLLWALERRAYGRASVVWVDTPLNASYMARLFDLPAGRFTALALSINEMVYARAPYAPALPGTPCTVLFIGTFVPLQGVDVIAQAIVLLGTRSDLRFRIIGDGQTAAAVAAILSQHACSNVSWERGWQSAEALAAEIRAADICLGIFGGGDKTQRVWPFKNYSYMAVGRALISADTPAARAMQTDGAAPAWHGVPAQRPDLLAQAILDLAQDGQLRVRLAEAAAAYYQRYLANARSLDILATSLGGGPREQ